MISTRWSKHVQAWNKLIVKQKFCIWIWLITEVNACRCWLMYAPCILCSLLSRNNNIQQTPTYGLHPSDCPHCTRGHQTNKCHVLYLLTFYRLYCSVILKIFVILPKHKVKTGTAVAQWLSCCATNRKVAGSIPDGVIGIFHWHKILPIALWPWGRLSL